MSFTDLCDWYGIDLMDQQQRLAVLVAMRFILEGQDELELLRRSHEVQLTAHRLGELSRAINRIREEAP